ncbi:uncharacterized protein isoform X2 [Musca autumnalis]|uniref:uncharacterized protein isoform X2 n=1 Tax=Musca autumnalis TaxID=221902 RepID=UPI003CF141CD
MLSTETVSATITCDRVSPMDISDDNFNISITGITATVPATTTETHQLNNNNNDNHTDLLPSQDHNTEILICDKTPITNCHEIDIATRGENDDDVEEEFFSPNNNNIILVHEDSINSNDGEDDIYIDTEEQLEEGGGDDDCGVSKVYLDEVEIDRNEEEQTITELVNAAGGDKIMQVEENKSMRVAIGVILRLIFPLANGVVRVATVLVSHRLEPILKLLKIRKSRDGIESLPDLPNSLPSSPEVLTPSTPGTPTSPIFSPFFREPRSSLPNFQATSRKQIPYEEQLAPNCCTLNILAEPPPGQPIRADIVFIHGLHGSLVNTWRQGLWENERKPVEFDRPPKPPVRPPKRPRHSRSTPLHAPLKQKRARFVHPEHKQSFHVDSIDELEDAEYSFVCGEPKDIQVCDGIEYSFPTFRMRMNDNGRLLQGEIDSILQEVQNSPAESEDKENSTNNNTNKNKAKSPKLTRDDPNYSKCWPGDWLPIDCPGVRVIALNYTTDQYLWRPLWKKKEPRSSLTQRAREMAELLIQHRVGYGHPIVWVGHSKGGLFIKQIIVDAWESGRPATAPFLRSSRGVFFYSVPHRGSHLASIKAPFLTRSVELIDIEKNSKYLLDLHRRFVGLYHLGHLKIEVFSFVETALTLMSVLYLRIVGVDSADPGIGDVCGIRLDHREICKPRSRDCILYKQLVNMINKVC